MLKIELKNFGPIESFIFDSSKSMNVIFGKNNIGKSYAISAVYLILKHLCSNNFQRQSSDLDYYIFNLRYSNIDQRELAENQTKVSLASKIERISKRLIDWFKNGKENEFNLVGEIQTIFSVLLSSSLLTGLENSIKNSYSSLHALRNEYSQKQFSIGIFTEDVSIIMGMHESHLVIKEVIVNRPTFIKKSKQNRNPIEGKDKVIYYCKQQRQLLDILFTATLRVQDEFRSTVLNEVGNVYFLPASRSGLYQALSTFSAVIAELSKSRMFLSNKLELPNISEPVSDYFLFLSNITGAVASKEFSEIVDEVENSIINGKILFNNDSKKIVFAPNAIQAELDIAFTSSMVSEIAPIVAFLKYVINKGVGASVKRRLPWKEKTKNIIFIEEPEAHLHPEIQVQLIQIFAKLAKKGLRIVMTSHSNYMFNKLSNLILAGEIDFRNVSSQLMVLGMKGSYLDEQSMIANEDGIIDHNFVDIAHSLYEERISIYDSLNQLKD